MHFLVRTENAEVIAGLPGFRPNLEVHSHLEAERRQQTRERPPARARRPRLNAGHDRLRGRNALGQSTLAEAGEPSRLEEDPGRFIHHAG